VRIIARPRAALEAAKAAALRNKLAVLNLGDAIAGDARVVAADHARLVRVILDGHGPVQPPCVILSGGETVVAVRGTGRGGPNTEYALGLARAFAGAANVWALAADTDGQDGCAGAAGALVTPDSLVRAAARGQDADRALNENDSGSFFAALGDLLVTGPTLTNVNDFRAVLILEKAARS
jgi:hydroxypyruvate reductase